MKAFIVDAYGKHSRLRAGQLPEPEIGDHDVLVRILASGVNPLDAKIMAGEFKLVLPYKPPFVLGNDLAGVVERVGPGVQRFAPGEEVYGLVPFDRDGAAAEFVAVPASHVAARPRGLDPVRSAALALAGLTARQALVDRAASTRLLPAALLERWEAAIQDSVLWQFQPTVVNGSLDAGSVLVVGDTVSGVLGWHDLQVGDPARDLAWLLGAPTPKAVDAAFEAYNTARALTDLSEVLLAREEPGAALPLIDEAIRILSEENADQHVEHLRRLRERCSDLREE